MGRSRSWWWKDQWSRGYGGPLSPGMEGNVPISSSTKGRTTGISGGGGNTDTVVLGLDGALVDDRRAAIRRPNTATGGIRV